MLDTPDQTGISPYTGYTGLRKRIPPVGAPDMEKTMFMLRSCNFYSTYRNRHMARMARNLWYYLGRQWIKLDSQIMADQVRGYIFRDISSKGAYDRPRPVTNFIGPACDNDIARLNNKEFVPKVPTFSTDPRILSAAKLGETLIQNRFDKQNWTELREVFTQQVVVCGGSGLRSGWDTPITDSYLAGSPTAVRCPNPGCGTTLSSPLIDRETASQGDFLHKDQLADSPDTDQLLTTACPSCPQPTPMRPTQLSPHEAQGSDYFARPLGVSVPKGHTSLDVVSVFETFPENGGVGVDPNKMRRVARAHPVDVDWIAERWPDKADELTPCNPVTLMKVHPLLGEWNYLGRYNSALDLDIYDNHMMLFETCVEPYVEEVTDEMCNWAEEAGYDAPGEPGDIVLNDGRHILAAGDERKLTFLEDSPLYIPYQKHDGTTGKVKKVEYAFARYKRRVGEFWADGLPDIGVGPQNRINAHDSRWIEAVDRMGSPNLLIPDVIEIRGPEWREEGSGKQLTYSPSIEHPEWKPEVLEGAAMPGEVWNERDRAKADLQDILNWQRVERGDNPPNVKNTSQLKLLGDNADAHRGPVERGISAAIAKVASHTLEMTYALRTEKETYEVDAKGAKAASVRYFRGADLLGLCNVKVEVEPGVDHDIYTSEGASEALQEQVYDVTDPVARSKYLELRGLPEINERVNVQITRAQEIGIDLIEQGTVYACDPTLHEPAIWYHILGNLWLDDDTILSWRTAISWDVDILPKIAGWDQDLAQKQQQDQVARAYYKDMPPAAAKQVHDQGVQAAIKAVQDSKLASDAAVATGQPPPPAPNLMPPPPLVFLPRAVEDQVYQMWCQMLGVPPLPSIANFGTPPASPATAPGMPVQQADPNLLHLLLQFRARVEAYRMYAEGKTGAAMNAPTGQPPTSSQGQAPPPAASQPAANQQGQQMPTGPLG